jgi:hypothetical protein
MMKKPRDNQRSRVYAWEKAVTNKFTDRPVFATLDECAAWLEPIWRAERGRLGRAGVNPPSIERPSRGQRRPLAHQDHRLTLPKWARNPWVILHEAAHRLAVSDEAHGGRFVGILIGLVARHDGRDADDLMRRADEMGVKYHIRSIGNVPVRGPAWHVENVIRQVGPMTLPEILATFEDRELDRSLPQIRGAALSLVRAGKARYEDKRLTLVG